MASPELTTRARRAHIISIVQRGARGEGLDGAGARG
jgi:hypothetical protein